MKKKRTRKYTTRTGVEKTAAVAFAKKHGYTAAANEYGISRSLLYRWARAEKKALTSNGKLVEMLKREATSAARIGQPLPHNRLPVGTIKEHLRAKVRGLVRTIVDEELAAAGLK